MGVKPRILQRTARRPHASSLRSCDADLHAVKERLGRRSIATLEKHLHALPDADATALDTLDRARSKPRAA